MRNVKDVFEKLKEFAGVSTYEELSEILNIPHANSISRHIARDNLPYEKIIQAAVENNWPLDDIFNASGCDEHKCMGLPRDLIHKLYVIYNEDKQTISKFLALASDKRFNETHMGRSLRSVRWALYRIAIESYDHYLWREHRIGDSAYDLFKPPPNPHVTPTKPEPEADKEDDDGGIVVVRAHKYPIGA